MSGSAQHFGRSHRGNGWIYSDHFLLLQLFVVYLLSVSLKWAVGATFP